MYDQQANRQGTECSQWRVLGTGVEGNEVAVDRYMIIERELGKAR